MGNPAAVAHTKLAERTPVRQVVGLAVDTEEPHTVMYYNVAADLSPTHNEVKAGWMRTHMLQWGHISGSQPATAVFAGSVRRVPFCQDRICALAYTLQEHARPHYSASFCAAEVRPCRDAEPARKGEVCAVREGANDVLQRCGRQGRDLVPFMLTALHKGAFYLSMTMFHGAGAMPLRSPRVLPYLENAHSC